MFITKYSYQQKPDVKHIYLSLHEIIVNTFFDPYLLLDIYMHLLKYVTIIFMTIMFVSIEYTHVCTIAYEQWWAALRDGVIISYKRNSISPSISTNHFCAIYNINEDIWSRWVCSWRVLTPWVVDVFQLLGPLWLTWLNFNPNMDHWSRLYKVWDKITHPLPNLKGVTVKVWIWIRNFIPRLTGHVINHPCWG